MCSSLHGEAAEYSFAQLTPEAVSSFELLEQALNSRFAEKCTTASYLAQLEARKLQSKDKLAEYVADIKKLIIKGYPTADLQTRETIGLRYFLKGLQDSAMAVAVGMKDPQTMEEARSALDTYNSLCDDIKLPRVRAIQSVPEKSNNTSKDCVTEERLHEFGQELRASFSKRFSELKEIITNNKVSERFTNCASSPKPNIHSSRTPSPYRGRKVTFNIEQAECYACHGKGHFARDCPTKNKAEDSDSAVVNSEDTYSDSDSESC